MRGMTNSLCERSRRRRARRTLTLAAPGPDCKAALPRHGAAAPVDRLNTADTDVVKRSRWAGNRELSAQRALAVVPHLESQGVDAKHLVARGWGDQRPVDDNSGKEGKAKNRRVEVRVAEHSGPEGKP
jgi:hypothetical protein